MYLLVIVNNSPLREKFYSVPILESGKGGNLTRNGVPRVGKPKLTFENLKMSNTSGVARTTNPGANQLIGALNDSLFFTCMDVCFAYWKERPRLPRTQASLLSWSTVPVYWLIKLFPCVSCVIFCPSFPISHSMAFQLALIWRSSSRKKWRILDKFHGYRKIIFFLFSRVTTSMLFTVHGF